MVRIKPAFAERDKKQTSVLQIHGILVWIWIRIRESMPLMPLMDPDPVIFISDLQDANNKLIV